MENHPMSLLRRHSWLISLAFVSACGNQALEFSLEKPVPDAGFEGCLVDGAAVAPGAASAANACLTCQPSVSKTQFSQLAEGSSCGSAKYCRTGSCISGCLVDTVVYAAGDPP